MHIVLFNDVLLSFKGNSDQWQLIALITKFDEPRGKQACVVLGCVRKGFSLMNPWKIEGKAFELQNIFKDMHFSNL